MSKDSHASENELKKLRDQISALDADILSLIQQRIQLARRVGEVKLKDNLPVKDYRVEKEVILRNREKAKALGLYQDMAEEVSKLLIRYAVLTQDEFHQQSRAQDRQHVRNVLIIGGKGGMGRWFANYFHSMHDHVTIWDPHGPENKETSYPETTDFHKGCCEADVIVLATPISKTAQTIEQVAATQTKALVFDVCSLKSPILTAVETARQGGLNITSVHPMFGPRAETLAGKNILLCDTGAPGLVDKTHELFGDTSAQIIRMPIHDHDRVMAFVLGLSHMTNLVFGQCLARSKLSQEDLLACGSTTFLAQLDVATPVAFENQNLYYEIQAQNTHTEDVLALMAASLDDFRESLRQQDIGTFSQLMNQTRTFFERAGGK